MRRTTLTVGIIALTMTVTQMATAQLPETSMQIDDRTALVLTDPQNDFLSPDGVAWGAVGPSVVEHSTVANIGMLLETAKETGMLVFISPHYYYPTDRGWHFEGALEVLMSKINMFNRTGPLSVADFAGSGADWLEQYKPFIDDGETVVTSPHKVYGPEANDLVLQLRKRGIDRVVLAGMSANLCVEAHLRELLEQGFEVAVVTDATAAAVFPDLDGYQAAMTNFRFIANDLFTTEEAVHALRARY
jgi:biuret amidohydrolase